MHEVIGGSSSPIRDPDFGFPGNVGSKFAKGDAVEESRHIDDVHAAACGEAAEFQMPQGRHRTRTVNRLDEIQPVAAHRVSDNVRQLSVREFKEIEFTQSCLIADEVFAGRVTDVEHFSAVAVAREEFFDDCSFNSSQRCRQPEQPEECARASPGSEGGLAPENLDQVLE